MWSIQVWSPVPQMVPLVVQEYFLSTEPGVSSEHYQSKINATVIQSDRSLCCLFSNFCKVVFTYLPHISLLSIYPRRHRYITKSLTSWNSLKVKHSSFTWEKVHNPWPAKKVFFKESPARQTDLHRRFIIISLYLIVAYYLFFKKHQIFIPIG